MSDGAFSPQPKISQENELPSHNYSVVPPSNSDDLTKVAKELSYMSSAPLEATKFGMNSLILRGAANARTPSSLSVTISDLNTETGESRELTFTKGNLNKAIAKVCKNKTIRRLAEEHASEISKFAEENKLQGDLAVQLNNIRLADGESPLTPKQKAWASSFNQNNPELETGDLLLVAQLLAKDFQNKFKQKRQPLKKAKSSPKKQGQNKPKKSQGNNPKKGK